MKSTFLWAFVPLILGGYTWADTMPCPASLPKDICEMQVRIYSNTNYRKTDQVERVMTGLKDLAIKHDTDTNLVKQHILSLADHVIEEANIQRSPSSIMKKLTGQKWLFPTGQELRRYEKEQGDVVPLGWSFPSKLHMITLLTEKYYEPGQDKTEYSVGLWGEMENLGDIEQLQIIRYPSEVILDKISMGNWNESTPKDLKSPIFSIGAKGFRAPLKEGLFLINVKAKGQAEVKGWFFLTHATPSAVPVVSSPLLSQTLKSAHPTFQWVDFQSANYRTFEHRKRRINISRSEDETRVWSSTEINPKPLNSFTLGKENIGEGVTELPNGSYQFSLAFEEGWLVGGGLFLRRNAGTSIPFSVGQ